MQVVSLPGASSNPAGHEQTACPPTSAQMSEHALGPQGFSAVSKNT